MLGTKGCLEAAWHQSIACVCEFLNHVVQEIRCADRLNLFDHCPHFPFFMTHFTDSMPIGSIGGKWSDDVWNSKYVLHVYKARPLIFWDTPYRSSAPRKHPSEHL